MAWFNSIEILSKLILIGQVLIVVITAITIWASVQKNRLEDHEKLNLRNKIENNEKTVETLTEENTKLSENLTESQQLLAKIEVKTSPRSLTDQQKSTLHDLISFEPNFPIAGLCMFMEKESCSYVEQFLSVFREANWEIGETNRTYLDDIGNSVAVIITASEQAQTAERIVKALGAIGITLKKLDEFREKSVSGLKPNTIYLVVGTKE